MILKALVEDQEYSLNVPDHVLSGAEEFCAKLDADMDQGWQMSREWVQAPNREQRCQIVADKLLTALEKDNHKLGMLMAAYILKRLPDVEAVELDIQGEMQNNSFRFRQSPTAAAPAGDAAPPAEADTSASNPPAAMPRIQAMAQAGQDVTKVFKVGKAWRYSVYDHGSAAWRESPLFATEQEAERARQAAFRERYEALIGNG
jgi:hypothetical protein